MVKFGERVVFYVCKLFKNASSHPETRYNHLRLFYVYRKTEMVSRRPLVDIVREAAWDTFRELGVVYLESHYRDCLCYFLKEKGLVVTCEETIVFRTSFGLQLLENGRIDIVVSRTIGESTEAMILELKARSNPAGVALSNAKGQTQRYINQFTRFGFVCPALLIWFAPQGNKKVGFLQFPAKRTNSLLTGAVI